MSDNVQTAESTNKKMKYRLFSSVLFILFIGLAVTAYLETVDRSADGPSGEPAAIQVDREPMDRSGVDGNPTSYADVLADVRNTVVTVSTTQIIEERIRRHPFSDDPFFRRFFGIPEEREQDEPRYRRRQGLGSGVIVSADGYILTNNHVIDGADEVLVSLGDRREFEATIVGSDAKTDVAVLKIDADGLPSATLTDSDEIRVGDIVFALGNPLNIGQTVTMGIVSATGRTRIGLLGGDSYENFIQTDAAINQGNSGGPLVDAKGRVIGINTAILSARTGGNIGIGFAIPVNMASNVMQSLITEGRVARGFIGVSIDDVTHDKAEELGLERAEGALVVEVVSDRPGDRAGLRSDDVIVEVNGRSIPSASALRLMISQTPPGTVVEVAYYRDGERRETEIELGDLDQLTGTPDVAEEDELLEGVKVSTIDDDVREDFGLTSSAEGLIVVEVDSSARHAEHFPLGTVITEINQTPVRNVDQAREALRTGRNVFLVHRDGVFRYLTITLE